MLQVAKYGKMPSEDRRSLKKTTSGWFTREIKRKVCEKSLFVAM